MSDPVELLQRLQVALSTGKLPDDVCAWLRRGLDGYLSGDSLELALGLKAQQGKRNAAGRLRLEQRDEIVRRLVRKLPGGPWQQAGTLAQAMVIYRLLQTGVNGRRIAKRPPLPAPLNGNIVKYLDAAAQSRIEIPSSQSQLYKILSGWR